MHLKHKNRIIQWPIHQHYQQAGFSLIEVMLASAIMGAVILGGVSLQTSVSQTTRRNTDKAFATEKVVQMYEEIRAFVEANQEENGLSLNDFSDGVQYNTVLTAELKAVQPDNALSKNVKYNGYWKYIRQIQVEPVKNDEFAKKVTVKIWYADQNKQPIGSPLASITGILKTNIPRTPPSQIFDYYTLAIANSPGWWSESYDFRPAYEAVTTDLEFRNPGLKFRKNYITQLGYGRDPFYLPHTNTDNLSESSVLPWAYYYPGKVKALNGTWVNQTKEAYVFDDMRFRLRGDSSSTWFHVSEKSNGATLYRPSSAADHFNHTLRFPELRAMEARLKNWALNLPVSVTTNNRDMQKLQETVLQPTLTAFLEDMNSSPNKYRHALLTNIHAEQTPVPPVRNYSDPARMPADDRTSGPGKNRYLNKRVVTHPEELHYGNTENITFRLHAFQVPAFGQSSIDRKADGTNKTPTEIVNDNLDVVSLFIPTDGRGRHPSNPSLDGYLDNPDFTPTLNDANKIVLHKLVGSYNRKYEWMSMGTAPNATSVPPIPDLPHKSQSNSTDNFNYASGTPRSFMVLTREDIYNENLTDVQNRTAGVQLIGQRLVSAVGNTLTISKSFTVVNPLTNVPTPAGDPNYNDLLNQPIVIHANIPTGSTSVNASREGHIQDTSGPLRVMRVTTTATGFIQLQLNRNPNLQVNSVVSSAVPIRVTRRRDYDLEVNPTVFGQTREGLHIKLYDTATMHPRHTNSYNATAYATPSFAASKTGLDPARRVYGLEYIPAPPNYYDTNTTHSDDFRTDLANDDDVKDNVYIDNARRDEAASNLETRAKNTARWTITLPAESSYNNQLVCLETRLGDNLEDGINGDGDTHIPNDGATPADENSTTLRANMYNVSRTYAYKGNYYITKTGGSRTIPKVEEHQFIGDPRYMPYADIKAAGGYNGMYFRADGVANGHKLGWGGMGSGGDNWGGYEGFDDQTGQYSAVGHIEADIPELYSLYSDGIMTSNSIYNTIAGYTNYIYSMGGEFGNRGNHNYLYNVTPAPWFATAPAGATMSIAEGSTGVAEQGGNSSQRVITANSERSGDPGDGRWFARPHLGELFPDELYAFWVANGNLPNYAYLGTHNLAPHLSGLGSTATLPANINTVTPRFFRAKQEDSPIDLVRRERIAQEGAVSDFYNGSGVAASSIDDRIVHHTGSGNGQLTASPSQAGRYLSDAFNLSLPETIGASRSWCLSKDNWCFNGNGTAATEYAKPGRRSRRNTLSYINITGPNQGTTTARPTANTSFYLFSGDPTKNVASSIFKLERKAIAGHVVADPAMVGYAVVNGLDQANDFGAQSLARLSVAATLQAYMEAGDRTIPGAATGRIVPLPRVEITKPQSSKIETGNNIAVEFKVSWNRWDGEKYSPSYPNNWYDSIPLRYNGMYSADNGATWKYISGNDVNKANLGYYNPSEPLFPATPSAALSANSETKTFNWNVNTLVNGNYLFRIEAYRNGRDNGYGYHEIFLTLKK